MKSIVHIIAILCVSSTFVVGQTEESTIFDEATILYNYSVYGGALIHTNGWGGHLTFGKNITGFKSRIFQFDLVGIKHPKEVRTYNPRYEDSRSYIYGKLNSFFVLRPTIGVRTVKFDKIRKSGVAIGYNWRVGPSLGFTKPVYLEIGTDGDSPAFQVVTIEKYDPQQHSVDNINGRAGALKGFDELKLHPGVTGAFALNFEYDPDREGLKGIEVGAVVDYYPFGEVEVMAFTQNYRLFFNFYVCLQFGKRYNKT